MDANYVCPKLIKWCLLFYGKDCKPFAKKKKEYYIFGSKKLNIKNKVSKEIAMYLATYTIQTKCGHKNKSKMK